METGCSFNCRPFAIHAVNLLRYSGDMKVKEPKTYHDKKNTMIAATLTVTAG